MDIDLMIIVYFMVVVIVVLALVMVKDKQFSQNLLAKKDLQQEEITDLKLEKVRLKHIIRMQDETIAHMLSTNNQQIKQTRVAYSNAESTEPEAQEWHLDQYESMNQEYYQA